MTQEFQKLFHAKRLEIMAAESRKCERLERIVTGRMSFGKSCVKYTSHLVPDDEEASLCPWCQKLESGQMLAESHENSNQNL